MFYTIYKITNVKDGKVYIGKHQTQDLNDGYMGSGKQLKRAQTKHGIENFKKEILFQFDNEDEMNAKEAELVTEEFCLRKDTYNLCPGGQGGFGYINNNSDIVAKRTITRRENTKWKDSTMRTGRKNFTDESNRVKATLVRNEKYPNGTLGFMGKTHSSETIAKMRRSKNVGQANSQFGTFWITDGQENRKLKQGECIPEGWKKGRS